MKHIDISQILEIQKACQLSPWTFNDYEQEFKKDDSLLFTAKNNREIIGFLISRLFVKSPAESAKADANAQYIEAEILNFGILESYRRHGVGSLLLYEFLQTCRRLSIESIWLEVRASNYKAISFYTNRGFTKIQRRRNFYSFPCEDAIVMKLQLTTFDKPITVTKLDSARDFEITLVRSQSKTCNVI